MPSGYKAPKPSLRKLVYPSDLKRKTQRYIHKCKLDNVYPTTKGLGLYCGFKHPDGLYHVRQISQRFSEELTKTMRAIDVAWSEHYVKLLMERNERERQEILRRHKLKKS